MLIKNSTLQTLVPGPAICGSLPVPPFACVGTWLLWPIAWLVVFPADLFTRLNFIYLFLKKVSSRESSIVCFYVCFRISDRHLSSALEQVSGTNKSSGATSGCAGKLPPRSRRFTLLAGIDYVGGAEIYMC